MIRDIKPQMKPELIHLSFLLQKRFCLVLFVLFFSPGFVAGVLVWLFQIGFFFVCICTEINEVSHIEQK